MLEIEDLCVSYGAIQALRGVSLELLSGEMVAVVGPNGAGKSTLLNALSGVAKPRAGAIRFEGESILGMPAFKIARRGLIQVPEGRQILPAMSVLENLEVGRIASGGRGGSSADIDRVYALFPVLAQRRGEYAGVLSGGQQQMLAIGRALMGRPRLLVLDEPSLGLSPIVSKQVFAVLTQLNSEGLPVLLVEQNARQALAMTRHAFVLEQGRVVHSGLSSALAQDPAVISHYLGQAQRRDRAIPSVVKLT